MICAELSRLRRVVAVDDNATWEALWSTAPVAGVHVIAARLGEMQQIVRLLFGQCPDAPAGFGGRAIPVKPAGYLAICAGCSWRNADWHCEAVTDVMACSSCLRLAASEACPKGFMRPAQALAQPREARAAGGGEELG